MENAQSADVFDEIADLLELRDENPFRIMSYRRAAQTARGIPPWINEKIAGMLRAIYGHEVLKRIAQTGMTPEVNIVRGILPVP
jgi:DNA polymerase/3'-5' exonuclease PolX